jgi:hypothetical protein
LDQNHSIQTASARRSCEIQALPKFLLIKIVREKLTNDRLEKDHHSNSLIPVFCVIGHLFDGVSPHFVGALVIEVTLSTENQQIKMYPRNIPQFAELSQRLN